LQVSFVASATSKYALDVALATYQPSPESNIVFRAVDRESFAYTGPISKVIEFRLHFVLDLSNKQCKGDDSLNGAF
jgi:hypothetical protein